MRGRLLGGITEAKEISAVDEMFCEGGGFEGLGGGGGRETGGGGEDVRARRSRSVQCSPAALTSLAFIPFFIMFLFFSLILASLFSSRVRGPHERECTKARSFDALQLGRREKKKKDDYLPLYQTAVFLYLEHGPLPLTEPPVVPPLATGERDFSLHSTRCVSECVLA